MKARLMDIIRNAVARDDRAPPVVELDDYFAGNDQEDSIAPNQAGSGRPALRDLYEALHAIAQRPDVQTVLVGIHEDWQEAERYEDIWPAGDSIHIYTRATRSAVEGWVHGLAANAVLKGWPRGMHRLAPEPETDIRVYTVVWD